MDIWQAPGIHVHAPCYMLIYVTQLQHDQHVRTGDCADSSCGGYCCSNGSQSRQYWKRGIHLAPFRSKTSDKHHQSQRSGHGHASPCTNYSWYLSVSQWCIRIMSSLTGWLFVQYVNPIYHWGSGATRIIRLWVWIQSVTFTLKLAGSESIGFMHLWQRVCPGWPHKRNEKEGRMSCLLNISPSITMRGIIVINVYL